MNDSGAKDPEFGKRLVGYMLAGIVSGGLAGYLVGDAIRGACESWLPLGWLPEKRIAYAILGAELFGIAGILRAVIRSRQVDMHLLTARALGLRYEARPPVGCMQDVALLFDGNELTDLRNVYVGSHRSFNFLVAEGYAERGDSERLNAHLVVVWNASLCFPRCIALPAQDVASWLSSLQQMQIRLTFGRSKVLVSQDPVFQRRYSVMGGKREAMAFLLNTQVQQLLLSTDNAQLRAGGSSLVLWQPDSRELQIDGVRVLQTNAKRLIAAIRDGDPKLEAWDKHSRSQLAAASEVVSPPAPAEVASPSSQGVQQIALQSPLQSLETPGGTSDVIQSYLASPPPRAWTMNLGILLGLRSLSGCFVGVVFTLFSLLILNTFMSDRLGLLMGGAIMAVGLMVLLVSTAFYRHVKRLLRYGNYAEAEVLAVEQTDRHPNKNYVVKLSYPVDSELIHSEVHLYRHEAKKLLVATETKHKVSLVYDTNRPKLCLIRQQFMHGFGLQE